MILLADGGSSKVEWSLISNGRLVKQVYTVGVNPFLRDKENIAEIIQKELRPPMREFSIDSVRFYGAGCTPEKKDIIRKAIEDSINTQDIGVESDLLGAARGLCQQQKGIACIIGTGSNSCYYDGENIVKNVPSLGFILGDEGSGSVLGRLFIGACFKNQLPDRIRERFLDEFNLTHPDILNKVYKEPAPNRFLASFAPFIKENINDKYVHTLVLNSFKDFITKNIMQYDYQNTPIYFTGSVAYHFRDVLDKALDSFNLRAETVSASPMNGLIEYYSKKQ